MRPMLRRLRRIALLGLAAGVPAASAIECAAPAPLANSFRLDYAVTATRSFVSLNGEGSVVYQRKGNAYTMESSLQALGVFEAHQSSAGTVQADGLRPRSFTQRSTRRPLRSVAFDWDAQRVSFSAGGASEPTKPQLQDRLSLLLHLAWLNRGDPRMRRFDVPVAGLRHVSDYVFNSKGAETVTVPAGRFETVKFERHKDDGDDALEVWIAPAPCSLPVKVRFTDDKGMVIVQELRAVTAQ